MCSIQKILQKASSLQLLRGWNLHKLNNLEKDQFGIAINHLRHPPARSTGLISRTLTYLLKTIALFNLQPKYIKQRSTEAEELLVSHTPFYKDLQFCACFDHVHEQNQSYTEIQLKIWKFHI